MEVSSVSDTQRAFYRLEWAQDPGSGLPLGDPLATSQATPLAGASYLDFLWFESGPHPLP